jgi:uncharacterized protein (DUF2336 family)
MGSQGRNFVMDARQNLIDELESAIANSEVQQRADVLRRITDLFATGSSGYSHEQVELFDDVMCRLVEEIETSARATFGQRLADMGRVPRNLVRTLASDDSIEVAGPLLSQCEQIDEETLVENARTKSQDHLLAISRRYSIGEAVTDVLLERGDQKVALSAAANPGAKFSEFGFSTLVKRSENDVDLALRVWGRHDVSRQHLLQLFAESSETVRRKIQSGDRRNADLVKELLAEASDRLQTRSRESSARYAAARDQVNALQKAGELGEDQLLEFARKGNFDETALALSLMSKLPIGVVERAIVHKSSEQIIVIAKAVGVNWITTKAILMIRGGSKGISAHDLAQSLSNFNKLKPETAEKAIKFYRMRERAAVSVSR